MSDGVSERSLLAAASGIAKIESGRITLDDFLDREAPADCRKIVGHLLFAYFRHRKFIRLVVAKRVPRTPRREVETLLLAAVSRILFQTGSAAASAVNVAVEAAKHYRADKFFNAVLRSVAREMPAPPAPVEELPDALLAIWEKEFTPENLAMLAGLIQTPAPVTFRLLGAAELPLEAPAVPLASPGNFRFFATENPEYFLDHGMVQRGAIYFQDPATAGVIAMAQFSSVQSVLDAGSAPGGKSLMLREKLPPDARLVALDRSAARQERTKENFARARCDGEIRVGDIRECREKFDLVLVDAPCSNSGVFRRRPDAMLRFNAAQLAELAQLQYELLEAAARAVNPGGQLLYSTCSIEQMENTAVVEKFLAAHPEFRLQQAEIFLPEAFRDGAGAAHFIKEA